MAPSFQDIVEEARLSARALLDYGDSFFHPTVRLGVTGLSRAGKTVFITALVHGLTRGGRFPIFEPYATGGIARAGLEPQPDDAVPRFDYENHVSTLIEERRWPSSTVDISELRLVIDYQRQNGADRTLTIDIVDYPGEWLLDLPLLNKSFEQWSAESLVLSREGPRVKLAAPWHEHLKTLDPEGRENEQAALAAAKLFTDYLRACRDERFAMSLLPPGRFLMPGNLAGSPALTFAPLDVAPDGSAPDGSLWAMMRRRYEAYKDVVVRPFFRDHFARLDRQVGLGDALAAFNAGPAARHGLQAALAGHRARGPGGSVQGRLPGPLQHGFRTSRFPLPAVPAAAAGAHGQRRARAASHSPRPRPPVSDRRPTAMSEKTPHRRPATFKLDDPGVVRTAPDESGRPPPRTVQNTPAAD